MWRGILQISYKPQFFIIKLQFFPEVLHEPSETHKSIWKNINVIDCIFNACIVMDIADVTRLPGNLKYLDFECFTMQP